MKSIVFLRSSRRDLRDEANYLRDIDSRLEHRFVDAVEIAARAAAELPEAMQIIEAEVRRWPVKSFPHGVLYRIEGERIIILSVFHPSRDPSIWLARTSS